MPHGNVSRARKELLQDELTAVFGPHRLELVSHTNQRNDTWLLRCERGTGAVVKWYRWLSEDAITGVIEVERRARDAGIPVPAVLHRSTHRPLVVYAHVDGEHYVPRTQALVAACAGLFVQQLEVLCGFTPTWAPVRPSHLPRRAQQAVNVCRDDLLGQAISESWQQLARLAHDQSGLASHTDWRADNILFSGGRVATVLDWEDVALLPATEATGYGAGSLTHSWREALYRPLALPPVMWFLEAAGRRLAWAAGSPEMAHARLAAFFTCAVRLAEDQHRERRRSRTTSFGRVS